MAETSPYVEHVSETARLVAGLAGVGEWELVWQSRSGPPSSPWLGPDITEVIGASGAAGVVVVPIGFVCENMEIVHDLDVEAAAIAEKKGAYFVRAPAVSTSPAFIRMVRELVQEHLSPGSARAALGPFGPWPDACPGEHCPARASPGRPGGARPGGEHPGGDG
jgi:ferrochelatase